MRTSRYIDCITVRLHHDDGQMALIKSPHIRKRVGFRMKFGWLIAIVGFWIMFGHYKEWQTIINPREDGGVV